MRKYTYRVQADDIGWRWGDDEEHRAFTNLRDARAELRRLRLGAEVVGYEGVSFWVERTEGWVELADTRITV
jgi:hypothetical protein